jgi:TonB-linked SusC/RagA family outer membrane protein
MIRHAYWLASALLVAAVGSAAAQTRTITGTVTDSASGEPVTSGQVAVVGTTITALIKDGNFSVAAPQRDVELSVRSVGFRRRTVAVPSGAASVRVSLARDYFQLEEVVVTGQATGIERRNLANAVATVAGEQLVETPTASVEQSLQGKLAGALINQNNGAPGGGNIVRMRGVTSIIGSFQPLYVIDGVIVSNAEIGRGTNLVQRAYTSQGIVPTVDNQDNAVNRIADINPNDIERVEVLKGAAASAIYGSKAANGVIMITTRRGTVGAPRFTLTQRVGAAKLSNKYGTRCFDNANDAVAVFGAQAAADFQPGVCHDFEDELYGGLAWGRETAGSVSGGSETTRYFSSLLVKHENGIVPGTFADKQDFLLNLDHNIGSRFTVSLGGDIIHTANDRGLFNNENNGSPSQAALSSLPSFLDFRGKCPDGTRVTNPRKPCKGATWDYTFPYAFSNPFQTVALVTNKESVWRTIMTGRVNWDLISGSSHSLRLTANGGGDVFTQKNQVIAPPEVQFEQLRGIPGSSAIGFGQSQNFNVNANLVYRYSFGRSSATTQAGVQYETADLDRDNTLSNNLVGGQTNQGSGTVVTVQEYRERIRALGFFAQAEFLTMDERLLLTVGARADKSSNDADPHKLFYYPKASASYRIPGGAGLLNELKVRAAYGQSGNLPGYGQKFTDLLVGNIAGLPVSSISNRTAAPDLRPERQTEVEGGLDATILSNRANLEITAYQKDIKDLLLTRTLTPTAGFTQLVFNGAEIRNRGLEVSAAAVPIETRGLQWRLNGTFFLNRCKVISTPSTFRPIAFFNFAQFGTTQIEQDSSCTQVFANDSIGRLPGDTGTVGRVVNRKIGDNSPDWRAGLSSDLSYKGFRLYALVDRQKGGLIVNFSRYTYDAVGTSADQKVPKKPGDLTGDERFARASKTALNTVTWDASYTKLREATLSYDLPLSWVRTLWGSARYVRVSLSGRNLLVFSKYKKVGYDPEVQQVARSLAAETTWELWAYPPSRSLYLTIDLGF